MFTFQKKYFAISLILFFVELAIGVYFHDEFIRPYVGDFLVVILIYCIVKSTINSPVLLTALSVLLFSYFVETLQYFNIVERLGLENSPIATIIIGNYFAWTDILAYTLGMLMVLFIEWLRGQLKWNTL